MANELAHVDIEFDDAGNATAVHVTNDTAKPIQVAVNGFPFTGPPTNTATVLIPSQGIRAFTTDTWSATARWPA